MPIVSIEWMHFLFPFKNPTGKCPPLLMIPFLNTVFSTCSAVVITLHLLDHLTQLCSPFLCSKLIHGDDFESTPTKANTL